MSTSIIATLAASGGHEDAAANAPIILTHAEEFAQSVLFTTVDVGMIAIGIAFVLCMWRLLKGPSLS